MMKSPPKSRRMMQPPRADSKHDSSSQSSSAGDSVSSSDSSSGGEGYEDFQKNVYALVKKTGKLKMRLNLTRKECTIRNQLGYVANRLLFKHMGFVVQTPAPQLKGPPCYGPGLHAVTFHGLLLLALSG